jgi:hypothetical protein
MIVVHQEFDMIALPVLVLLAIRIPQSYQWTVALQDPCWRILPSIYELPRFGDDGSSR